MSGGAIFRYAFATLAVLVAAPVVFMFAPFERDDGYWRKTGRRFAAIWRFWSSPRPVPEPPPLDNDPPGDVE